MGEAICIQELGTDKQEIQGQNQIPSLQRTSFQDRGIQVLSSSDTAELFWQILPPFGWFSHLSQTAGGCFPTFIFGMRIFCLK